MPVDVNQALDLKYNRHLSYAQIAAIQGVTPQAIHQKIKDLLPIPETKVYQDHRADILDHLQLRVLSNLDDAAVKNMMIKAPGAAALWFNSLYNNARLERGQSTENIEVHTITARRAEIKARREELLARRELSTVGTAANNDASIRNDTT